MSTAERRPIVLIVDDEPAVVEALKALLSEDYGLLAAGTGQEALELVSRHPVDLILLDLRLPDLDGLSVLKRIKEFDQSIPVIIATATDRARAALDAMQAGAADYLTKPFEADSVLAAARNALEKERLTKETACFRSRPPHEGFGKIIGSSPRMRQVYSVIRQLAKNDATVLISGESGTGKELTASAIHFNSLRQNKPFIPINCASIPENMLESELFGHEKGAFTGAAAQKLGMLELAHEGTVFLDEVSDLRLDMQAKLLRAFESREIKRVGGTRLIRIDVRIISATNVDLMRMVEAEKFRKDLYYRLNVVPFQLPPLRERGEDIILLTNYFIKFYNRSFRKRITGVTDEALGYLSGYHWPGNVRELKNIIERTIALKDEGLIDISDLPLDMFINSSFAESMHIEGGLKDACRDFQRRYIQAVLERVDGNQSQAARVLGLHRNALSTKMKTLGLR
ncbi:MAG: sigma-54 dependent transcriptional regulator [Candidatus Omnitrophica bacterium]|nr:sigma-54 dependent transcriptional regulator [Candidatus Omnitrophota bacterium]